MMLLLLCLLELNTCSLQPTASPRCTYTHTEMRFLSKLVHILSCSGDAHAVFCYYHCYQESWKLACVHAN